MDEPYHIFKDGTKLMIVRDDMPESPREWSPLGTMVCFHKRHNLGDKHEYHTSDYSSMEEIEDQIYKDHDPLIVLPLYLYDHSGITMNTIGFSCTYDSGQVGFIYVSKERVREEYGAKRTGKKQRKQIEKYLIREVEVYDQFLTGDIWGFQLIDTNGDEIDSCYGFYGDDPIKNGMIDNFEEKYCLELKVGCVMYDIYVLEIKYKSGAIERIVDGHSMGNLQILLNDRFELVKKKKTIGKTKYDEIIEIKYFKKEEGVENDN